MKIFKMHLKPLAILLLALLMASQSAMANYTIGNYITNSPATLAHENYGAQESSGKIIAFPLAVAAGLVLGAAFVVGVVDGYRCGDTVIDSNYGEDIAYQQFDFAQFDA